MTDAMPDDPDAVVDEAETIAKAMATLDKGAADFRELIDLLRRDEGDAAGEMISRMNPDERALALLAGATWVELRIRQRRL